MQNLHHLALKIRIPALHVIADLVWPDLTSPQNPMQFGTAQFQQAGMTRFDAVSSEVLLQNRVRPKFVRVPQIFGLLTGAMQHPGDCIVRNAAAFPRSRKLSQRRLQTELKVFLRTQCNRVAIHAVTAGDGAITPSAGGVQEDRGVHYHSSLSTTGTAKTLQLLFLFRRKDQRLSLREERHKPFLHEIVLMV